MMQHRSVDFNISWAGQQFAKHFHPKICFFDAEISIIIVTIQISTVEVQRQPLSGAQDFIITL